jgi:hypothetical protein
MVSSHKKIVFYAFLLDKRREAELITLEKQCLLIAVACLPKDLGISFCQVSTVLPPVKPALCALLYPQHGPVGKVYCAGGCTVCVQSSAVYMLYLCDTWLLLAAPVCSLTALPRGLVCTVGHCILYL